MQNFGMLVRKMCHYQGRDIMDKKIWLSHRMYFHDRNILDEFNRDTPLIRELIVCVVAVEGGGQGDSTVPGKGGGCAIRWGLALGTLIWEEKWLGRGIKTCAWERNRGSSWPLPTFFHHRVHTWRLRWHPLLQQHLPLQGTFLQRHQPGRESGPFLDQLARIFLIRKPRVLWSQEPFLGIEGCHSL